MPSGWGFAQSVFPVETGKQPQLPRGPSGTSSYLLSGGQTSSAPPLSVFMPVLLPGAQLQQRLASVGRELEAAPAGDFLASSSSSPHIGVCPDSLVWTF